LLSRDQQGSRFLAKTPRIHRTRLSSIFRRLSLRNFMDYCVAALNEASSSSCSNKFDPLASNATVWLLGRQYELPDECDKLVEDIRSKLWITYRRNFPPLDATARYTSDRGFGCMIRCGQMVLANALLCKNLGRDWRWSSGGLDENPEAYFKILKLFQDNINYPYSIHRIVHMGQRNEGKGIGEWFGPNTIAQALKKLSYKYQQEHSMEKETFISIDAALDNVVVIDEIKSRFRGYSDDPKEESDNSSVDLAQWVPGILFIQLRLGLTKINPLYFSALKKTFRFRNSLGIIGGRPNHALYLVGYTEDDIIYLDPHNTQQYIDLDEATASSRAQNVTDSDSVSVVNNETLQPYAQYEDLGAGDSTDIGSKSPNTSQPAAPTSYQISPDETYHCSCPEKMAIDKLDPSLALCFYFDTEAEFDSWCNISEELLVKSEQAPMFEITKSRPKDWDSSLISGTNAKSFSTEKSMQNSSDQDDEFEILT